MIRTVPLICSECGKEFIAAKELYYRDNYLGSSIRDTSFLCPGCIRSWQEKWQISNAVFQEEDYVLTVTLELADGSVYNDVDCTPIEETGTVVTAMDIPLAAQQKLYTFYAAWDAQRKAHCLKDCTFKDEFMRTSFTCTTYGGEQFSDVAFRFNLRGELETERPIPAYIQEQVLAAYKIYAAQKLDG